MNHPQEHQIRRGFKSFFTIEIIDWMKLKVHVLPHLVEQTMIKLREFLLAVSELL